MRKKEFKDRFESKMVSVTDDWFPCYPDNQIKVTITLKGVKPYPKASEDKMYFYVGITAWGMDDFGLELIYNTRTREVAETVYTFWRKYIYDLIPEEVDKEWFYQHAFLRV